MNNKSKTSLAELRSHMFDVIERLKSSNDPDADQKDKIDIETAKAISAAGKIIIDAAKVEVDAMKLIADHIDITKPFRDSDSLMSLPENL
jgi:hypothetical protein